MLRKAVSRYWCRLSRWCRCSEERRQTSIPTHASPVTTLNSCLPCSEMSSKEGTPGLAGSGALFANQLCGFRRPESTSGLSTPSTLFRKLERLVVASEMTRLKFWSWHRLLLLRQRRQDERQPEGLVAWKPELRLSPQATALQQACNCSTPLSCGQRKNFIRQKVSILLKRWGERGGSWAVGRGRIYNSENHVFGEFSPFTQVTPCCSRCPVAACVLTEAQTTTWGPHRGEGPHTPCSVPEVLNLCALDHMAWLGCWRTELPKLKWATQSPVREATLYSISALPLQQCQ